MEYMVTVYCLAFDQEKYIRHTLEGFVNQKTTFPFKVIVHDDASTDGTKAIISEFAQNYPDIIFPVYQTVNQYSQGKDIFAEYITPHIEGKYIAICEGDDFWNDPDKLQIQYDYMEGHPDCSLCTHNTSKMDEAGKDLGSLFNHDHRDRDYTTEEIIDAGGGGLFHTCSFFMRKECRLDRPALFSIPGVGDYTNAIWLSLNGSVHYIDRVMSSYRVNASGSWSSKNRARAVNIRNRLFVIDGLKKMDSFTERRFHKHFQKKIVFAEFVVVRLKRQYWKMIIMPKYWKLTFKLMKRRFNR